jgi:hypothetical protein
MGLFFCGWIWFCKCDSVLAREIHSKTSERGGKMCFLLFDPSVYTGFAVLVITPIALQAENMIAIWTIIAKYQNLIPLFKP